MKTSKILAIFSLLSVAIFTLPSCEGDPAPDPVVEYGKVLLFNGAPGSAAVDLYLDGAKSTATPLQYGQASAYVNAIAGTTERKIVTRDVTGKKIDSVSLKLNKDVGYSYYAYKDNDAAGTVKVLTTTDVLTAPAAGKAKVRLIHLIGDITNNVGIDIEAAEVGKAASARNDFTNVKFKESRDFIELAKGTYDLKVKSTGTTNLVINKTISITLAEGKIYTLVAHGLNAKLNSDPQYSIVTTVNNN